MTLFLYFILIFNSLIGLFIYKIMYRKGQLLSENYTITIAKCASSVLSLNIGMNLLFLLPTNLSLTFIITVIISGSIGVLFGSLLTFQSLLSVLFHGIVGGLMGTMLGAVIQNPTLCSLPTANIYMIEQNIVIFSLFGSALMVITNGLLHYSYTKIFT